MKLKPQYEKYQDLFNKGFRFDPEEHLFYTADPSTFKKPEGFEDWEIKGFDSTEYLQKRLNELGVSEEENKIELFDEKGKRSKSREEFNVFTANKFGDIEILQYSLHRKALSFLRKGKENANHESYHAQVRLNPLYADFCDGKYDFSEAKNTPFWHRSLIEAFENKSPVPTLVITEGQFKAFKASKEGIPTVGLTSISHFKDRSSGKLHTEIIEFIRECDVQKVIILWDADCRDISLKQLEKGEDVSKRPYQFFKFARSIREMLQEYFIPKRLQIFFGTIQELDGDVQPKGIDDLLIFLGNGKDVRKDIESVGSLPGRYIFTENITTEFGIKKLRAWFKLDYVSEFYRFHQEKIRNKNFIFQNNTYKIEKGSPIIEVSADLKVYKRIGTNFYKLIQSPVPTGKKGDTVTETVLEPWSSDIIKQDHGKDSINQIERFEGFTNIASHVDYKEVIDGHWNLYYNIDHAKQEGDFPTIRILLDHLFKEHYENEMILDYLTVLYRFPMQKLPVICLVSEAQGTGKSTFLYLLKLIFKQNMAVISNNDLTSDFNSQWTSKLIVASEETLLEKKDGYEKIKSLSTAKTIMRNEKNKTAKEIPCMVHFVFCSNHENDFIKINDYDSRLWIRKVDELKEQLNDFDQKLEEEIPQLINFIENREIRYQEKGRLWFHPKDFRTAAFYNLVKHSEPSVIKEIREILTDSFLKYGGDVRKLTANDFKMYFGIRGEVNYLNKVIKGVLKAERTLNSKGEEYVTTYSFPVDDPNNPDQARMITSKGRPFEFRIEQFIKNPENIPTVEAIQEPEELPF